MQCDPSLGGPLPDMVEDVSQLAFFTQYQHRFAQTASDHFTTTAILVLPDRRNLRYGEHDESGRSEGEAADHSNSEGRPLCVTLDRCGCLVGI